MYNTRIRVHYQHKVPQDTRSDEVYFEDKVHCGRDHTFVIELLRLLSSLSLSTALERSWAFSVACLEQQTVEWIVAMTRHPKRPVGWVSRCDEAVCGM
jgi:hypothetical protein